ncbi:MAG: putative sigma-54 modulation protein [Moorella sp. (in: firmicutes)]|jgi:putative sigma-54 modulation protein|uniref:ribosome hibernation-promoting factor, HPF/YfiA family n=1 Tax=unclassified Neomoorella TaxID=2676739 RepID=UPI0010FFB089|nr:MULTISPECIES: ribosome-associated translation inhibitor RaiA [unclassified Moorella (in: firmicutes)]MDK2816972.1 putative sigma-54 modulation protein [Moorella sp. (in: firmicutes)]GEA14710.1 ribosomal subunit interface protein [Moorella sp. E308F]GEA17916.1 ribosomal subunit interface protein [Moorella sp. E306M]
MKIVIRGKNFPVTDALKQYIEKRLGKIQRYLEGVDEVQVNLSVNRDSHVVEVTIPLNGYLLRGEEATGDMYGSVDLVVEKLEKQIEKYKTKLARKLKNGTIKELPAENPEEVTPEPKLIRTKRFPIKPMPVEEAILQMNLLGHNFFVFSNAETEEVNVLYRRRDGNYGLIEPEY